MAISPTRSFLATVLAPANTLSVQEATVLSQLKPSSINPNGTNLNNLIQPQAVATPAPAPAAAPTPTTAPGAAPTPTTTPQATAAPTNTRQGTATPPTATQTGTRITNASPAGTTNAGATATRTTTTTTTKVSGNGSRTTTTTTTQTQEPPAQFRMTKKDAPPGLVQFGGIPPGLQKKKCKGGNHKAEDKQFKAQERFLDRQEDFLKKSRGNDDAGPDRMRMSPGRSSSRKD